MFLGLQRRHMRGTSFGTLGMTNSIRPLFRQAGDSCRTARLGVEQPMPRICVILAPLPQVFRHAASLGRRTETPRRCADPGICLTHESRLGPWLDMEVVWGESVPRYHEAANIPRVGIRPS